MCGIYGMLSLTAAPLRRPELAGRMAAAIRHRGPDGHGEFRRPNVLLGTDRLRIVDLHERADQPFSDPGERLWIVCNGEIYNSRALRRRYPDYPFRSHSDVESLVPLFLESEAGPFEEIDGMFAVAVWDEASRSLLLARDRAGEKPLFYCIVEDELWFASEPTALLVHPHLSREIDRDAVEDFLNLGYVLEPRTLHREIRRVPAGSVMRIDGAGLSTRSYWDPRGTEAVLTPRAAVDGLTAVFEQAVRRQIVADVPLGIYASGGLDSSLLAAMAVRNLGREHLRLFSIRFPQHSYDESQWAEKIARSLDVEHTTVVADERALGEALEIVTSSLAEPIADPAVLPTYLLSRRASESVKVVVSGEGADELFGGYPTYLGHRAARWYQSVPGSLRQLIRSGVGHLSVSAEKMPVEYLLKRFVGSAGQSMGRRHVAWFGTGLLRDDDPSPPWLAELDRRVEEAGDPLNEIMFFDYRSYLRDNLLVKIDRASMLASIESRTPYLDRELTKLAFSIPSRLKLRRSVSKWILKKAGERYIPKEFVHRRKRGLSVPVAGWINDGLRQKVDHALDPVRLKREGMLPAERITTLLAEHRTGTANHIRVLWPVFILQMWMERWSTR